MSTLVILLFLLLLFFSALFSASETALVGISKYKAKKVGKYVEKLKENEEKALITILIGNNLVNVALSVLASLIAEKFGGPALAIATFVVTLLIVTFGEVIPKSFAIKNKEAILRLSSPLIYFLMKILSPIVYLYYSISSKLVKGKETLTKEEVEAMLLEVTKHPITRIIADNLFDLSQLKVKHVLTPWNKVVKFYEEETVEKSLRKMKEKRITKLVDEEGNYYTFVLDLLFEEGKTIRKAKKAKKIPETTTLATALSIFKKEGDSLLVVVDEFGNPTGIVTLRDVLEGLIGSWNKGNIQVEGKRIIASGDTLITELDDYGINLPIEDYSTIAGLVLSKLGRPARVNDTIELNGYKIVVRKVKEGGIPAEVEILLK